MNIAELKGEKTVATLAKRLLAEPATTGTAKTTQGELEATLLRLNPHLSQIGDLDRGTPIVVPDEFDLNGLESVNPLRCLAEEMLRQAESALTNLRATLKERAAQAAAESERAQAFLKSDQAKELVRNSAELKTVFTNAATAAKALPKEQASAVAAESKALDKVRVQLTGFRVT